MQLVRRERDPGNTKTGGAMNYTLLYYLALGLILVIGIWVQLPRQPSYGQGHTMAVNVTRTDTGCKLYWLGGTDYDSFVDYLVVDGRDIGHPLPGTEIYDGPDCNATVKMYMRDIMTLQQIHPVVRR